MVYKIRPMDMNRLAGPVAAATAALARLDERLARSPVGSGWIERQHFADAVAALWLEGELVHVEDLVLHDAHMDIRLPAHELTRAHAVLRARRKICAAGPEWALSAQGLHALTDRGEQAREGGQGPALPPGGALTDGQAGAVRARDGLDRALDMMDAVLARSAGTIAGQETGARRVDMRADERPLTDGECEPDAQARLGVWLQVLADTVSLPPVLRAAVLIDAWNELDVLARAPWLGPLLAGALMRQDGLAANHLPALHAGARQIPRDRRRAPGGTGRLAAAIDAIGAAANLGLKEHDRLMQLRGLMERRIKGRRRNSRLPGLMELMLCRPLVTAPLAARELKTSLQGALDLIGALGVREVTGRGRYRAWTAG